MTDHDELSRTARRLPQLARHPQPRGRRRRALPREDGARTRRARRPGHHLLRGPRRRTSGRGRRRRPFHPARVEADRLLRGRSGRSPAAGSDTWTSSWTCRTACPSSPAPPPGHPSSCSCTTCTASSGRSSTPGSSAGSAGAIEHGLAPRLYRSCQYVAVSRATRDELVAARRGPSAHRRRAQRHGSDRAHGGREVGSPHDRSGRTAGPPQAGRARHRRGPRPA